MDAIRHFTSDTHFGHARIIELSNRPFRDVAEMNEIILARAWETVGVNDELWVLGDLALGTFVESMQVAARLPGRKHLVVGNHDRVFQERSPERLARFTAMYEDAGFTIHHGTAELQIAGRPVLLSHFPYFGDSQENDRHLDARPADDGLPLLHGHIHEMRHIAGRMFNVGVDVNDFRPVHQSAIEEWLKTLSANAAQRKASR